MSPGPFFLVYDSSDRLVRTEYSDGTGVSYTYTPGGLLKTAIDAQGTTTSMYDNRGRLKTRTDSNGDTITYSYDGVGNILTVETSDSTITKTYDKLNRLKTVTDQTGTTTYSYDAIGRQTEVTYPNSIKTLYEYDVTNRLTKITNATGDGKIISSFAYTLDNQGNRIKVVEHSGRTVNYTYDTQSRLTKETVSHDSHGHNTVTTYAYDPTGNLITKTVDGITTSYSYNANDQLTQQGTESFTYDSNGNLLGDGNVTYTYDSQNRLTEAATPSDTVTYAYDSQNNRIGKTVNGEMTSYLIDTNTKYAQVIKESSSTQTIGYTYGNDLIAQHSDQGAFFYHYDAIGSTRSLTDANAQVTDSYVYAAYGKLIDHNGTSTNSFLFTGEQFDHETQNYYLRARYYAPQQARFTSIDPFEGRMFEPVTLNDYIYAGDNPVMYVDLSGEMFNSMSVGSVLSSMNSLSNLYTIASIGVDIAGGNYVGASKEIMEEIVSSKLGRIRAIGNLGNRGLTMFAKMFSRGKPPVLNLASTHSGGILAKNMKALGFSGNGNAAHHIIGSGKKSKPANTILKRAKININSPSNGVFLPKTKTWRTSSASPHRGGHNDEYWDFVNSTLKKAVRGKSPGTDDYKWAVINAISEIRVKLLTGQISLNKNKPFN